MELAELWQQIVAFPADKNLQALYVETLTKDGSPRAKMFRLAVELDELIFGYFEREQKLTAQYKPLEKEWRAEFEPQTSRWDAEITFDRGWPIELTLSSENFALYNHEIIATLPIRHLNLLQVSDYPAVFETVALSQIASIDASEQNWTAETVTALTQSPYLSTLRWLDLHETNLDDALIEQLAAALNLRQLDHLELSRNPGRDPVDAAAGCGIDGVSGLIVPESIWLPEFGRELEHKYGRVEWLHAFSKYMEEHPPDRYQF